jgi:hypothetical protein
LRRRAAVLGKFDPVYKQLQAALVYVRSKVDLLKTPEKRLE